MIKSWLKDECCGSGEDRFVKAWAAGLKNANFFDFTGSIYLDADDDSDGFGVRRGIIGIDDAGVAGGHGGDVFATASHLGDGLSMMHLDPGR